MRRLTDEELLDLEDQILDRFGSTLARKNVDGTLDRLLAELGMSDLMPDEPRRLQTYSDGKILVVGVPEKMRNDVIGVAKSMGVSARRVRVLSYDEVTNYDFGNLRYNPTWCAVLFGQAPHSARGKADSGSIIAEMESDAVRYPTTRRLMANSGGGELKVTKTNVRTALEDLISSGVISVG